MGDEPMVVSERGLVTASDEVWDLAVRRAEVIGRLARGRERTPRGRCGRREARA